MNNNVRFSLRFFLMTFIWSWILWTPLVLCSYKIITVSDRLLSFLTFPVIMLGAFGPLAGALFVLHQEKGKGFIKKYLQSFLDFNLGWKAYTIWRKTIINVITVYLDLYSLFNIYDLSRWRSGRIWLARICFANS